MINQRFQAQVRTQNGKLLHIGRGRSAPEAFGEAWAFMRARLSAALPPDMEIVMLNQLYGDVDAQDDIYSMRHAYVVCRTQSFVKRSKQDCEECGFPDVPVETGYIRAADSMGFLHMENLLHALVEDGPTTISSATFRRQLRCECCDMLAEKGVRSGKDVRA
jgi:hypothetical protein